jgi:prefoldin subunit 5
VFVIIPVEVTDTETTLAVEPTAEEEAELKKAIQAMFEQMEEADVRIRRCQDEIDRLSAETKAMLALLRAEMKD